MISDLYIKLKELKINIKSIDGRLDIQAPKGVLNDELLNEIKYHKTDLIALINLYRKQKTEYITIAPAPVAMSYALSSSQRRLWVLSQFEEGNVAYNIPGVYEFEGDLDRSALEESFKSIIERHEILRTVFKEDAQGEIKQWIKTVEEENFAISYLDLRKREDQEIALKELVEKDFLSPFDLATGPLLRAGLYQVGEKKWVFSYVMHHIISDGWSMGILIKELLRSYNAKIKGASNPLIPLNIQYKDYAVWQQEQLSGENLQEHKAYWLNKFQGELPVLELSGDKVRPTAKTYNGGVISKRINSRLSQGIKQLSQAEGGTLFMGLLAAVKTLLYRYSNQEDIIVGSPVAGREHSDLEDQIGFYINTLALRTQFKGEDSYIDLLKSIKQVTLGAYEHQVYPFDELVNELHLERNMSRSALFDVMVVLQNADIRAKVTEETRLGDLQVSNYQGEGNQLSKFDLTFNFVERGEEIQASIGYNSDIYNKETVENLGNHLIKIIEQVVENPSISLKEIDYLSSAEKHKLVEGFNDTKVDYPKEKTIVDLFEEQVKKTPNNIALVFEEKELSYKELNEKSNQLARYLQKNYKIKPDDLVGIKLERSEWMIISILGILKSGGAYVPIDPEYPQERVDYMVSDSKCKLVIDEEELLKFEKTEKDYSKKNLKSINKSSDLAYVIYTSGSTGKPKGCMLEHQGIINRIGWMWSYYGYDSSDIILQKTTYTFDVSVWELFMPLCWGAKMVLCHKEDIASPNRILSLIEKQKVTCLHFVPSMLHAFITTIFEEDKNIRSLNSLRSIITSGEALPVETVKHWYDKMEVPIHNLYGPTEASVDVTYYATKKGDTKIPIGRPISNTQLYILGKENQLLPIGVVGEICIGGDGLARGYLGKPELTSEKFVKNPFKEGERMYKTGDLARWLLDGNIEFIGRKDYQVKIRGYRIELGEIEYALKRHKGVESCTVLARENEHGEKNLIAYIVPNKDTAFTVRQILKIPIVRSEFKFELYEMENGISIYSYNKSEAKFLYKEIFSDRIYSKNGITIPPNACIIDVGANIGAFSIFAAVTSENARIYSFEPLPPIYDLLKDNISLYKGDIKVFNLGLSDKEEEVMFDYYPYATVLSGRYSGKNEVAQTVEKFIRNTEENKKERLTDKEVDEILKERLISKKYKCKLKTLSQVIKENGISKIDLLKIDVENGEMDVLNGICEEDWQKIDQMVMEIHNENGRLEKVKQRLYSYGFDVVVEQSEELIGSNLYDVYALKEKKRLQKRNKPSFTNWHGTNVLTESITQLLSESLPHYMVPFNVLFLEKLPLTSNGKLDHKALLKLANIEFSSKIDLVAPRNETEEKLVKIWQEVLQRENIGVKDDFFKLGGHSLKMTRLMSRIHKDLEVKLELKDLFVKPILEEQSELILKAKKTAYVTISPAPIQRSYALSSSQRRLWVLSQFEEGSVAYNIPGVYEFEGDLDRSALEESFKSIIERHEILRTLFKEDEQGDIRQWIKTVEEQNFSISYLDLRKEEDQQEVLKSYVEKDFLSPFDLSSGPLLRAGLYQVGERKWVFSYVMHHIISDGWSMGILIKELLTLYNAYIKGESNPLVPLGIQYKDYALWQQAQLSGENLQEHKSYWLEQFTGELPVLELAADKIRPAVKTYNGGVVSRRINSKLSQGIKQLSQAEGGTLFMGLLAAVKTLLYRYSNQEDIIVGSPVAGREHTDLEDQIGFYINTIALRTRFKGEDSYIDLLKNIKQVTLGAYEHQVYPFDEQVDELHLERDMSRSALFDVMVVLQNADIRAKVAEETRLGDIQVRAYQSGESQLSKFDLTFNFIERGEEIQASIEYNSDIYNKQTIECLGDHLEQLLNAIIEHPNTSLKEIDYLSSAEKHKLVEEFNDTKVDYPKEKTIVDLFEEQVKKTPNNIALVFEEKELSYKELNEKSNQLARYLQKNYKIKPDDLVGIKLERSEWMIISILGILKSGGAYVPIDPEYPQERVDYIEKDTKCKVCIDEEELSKFQGVQSGFKINNAPIICKSNNLVYVIYTSGSTGRPKGVLVEHGGVLNRLLWMGRDLKIDESDIFLQKTPTTFDVSVWELFLPLISGSKLVIAKPDGHKEPIYLEHVIKNLKISIIHFVPSMLSSMLENMQWEKLENLRHVICSGEALSKKSEELFKTKSPIAKLHNYYGPTEASVDVTTVDLTQFPTTRNEVSIGKPVDNTSIYIVNPMNKLQPIGVLGEILIGGDQLARGYLNQEELTKEKFIANPFKAGERLYKTGDLGRWTKEGDIEFIGRKDHQVKIRGYRIELGEIEHALLKNEQIKSAVVVVKENQNKEKELVAYITANTEQNTNDLRNYLKEILPEYMLPVYYVQLEALPLTSNGKIDKKSLPDPQGLGLTSGVEYVAPRTTQEKVLALVWSDVLKREDIGIKDSFYNLGGDSIKSIQVVSRLKQKGYTLKVEHLLRTPVLEELAKLMQESIQISDQSEVKGRVELTPIQKWFFEEPKIKVHDHYNQSVLLQSKEELDKKLLEKSISDLIRHHDALRMVYKKTEGAWEQINQDTRSKSYTIDFYDLREADNALEQMSELGEELQSDINLSDGPLFRVAHFRLKDGDRLGLIIHHLVVDGVSWRILLEDLSSLYTSYKEKKKAALPLKTDSFQRWSLMQKEYAQGNKVKKERAYWEEICSQQIECLALDKEQESAQSGIGASVSFSLDKRTTELLQTRVHGVYNTEINDLLLTGLGLAIKEVFSIEKSVLKMEGHGREEIIDGVDISRTVGWFTTMYPFVLDVSRSKNATESLVGVKEALRKIPNKGIGYGILNYLTKEGIEGKLSPEIVFNYLGDFGANAGGSNQGTSLFEYTSEHIGSNVSKKNGNDAILDVSGMLVKGELSMSIRYSKLRYDSTTIEKLIKSYEKTLKSLIKELSNNKHTYLTPSDLSFKGLRIEELSEINSEGSLEDVYELSPLQQGIYYHWLSANSSSLYFEQMSYRIRAKEINVENLKFAYDSLIARHGVLRTSFSNDYAGRSLQIVRKEAPSNFTYEKIEDQSDKEGYVQQIKQKDRERGFDLSSPSQMRLHIIDLKEGEYEFIWSHHHILMDGWCMSILINDFNQLLSSATMGSSLDMSPVRPYSNYINWLNAIDKESSVTYWKEYLTGYSQLAEIPFKKTTEEKKYVGNKEHLKIDGKLFKKVDALCNQLGITQNTFIQGVWGYLLSRYNNTNDVVFGAVVSGRPAELAGVEDMIGLFINTIPVRVKYESGDTPIDLLKALQDESIQSTSNHYMNLSEVQSLSELGMNLIDHIMVFENYAVKEFRAEGVLNAQREEAISIESMEVFEQTNYDFSITVGPSSSSLSIEIKYNTNAYDSSSLKRLIRHFDNLISEFVKKADQPLHTFNYLSQEEKHELLVTFNDTKVEYPQDKTIVELFEEQVVKTPDNVAVVFEEKELTYKELNEQSNQLAHYLQKNYAIQPDDLVGIKQDRSERMIVSILGILKSGGAYMPIDQEYPKERVDYMLEDSKCKVLIDEEELEKFKKAEPDYSKTNPKSINSPHDLAYVIYTSGSTGKPKGVFLSNRNLHNRLQWMWSEFPFTENEVCAAKTSISFVDHLCEIFSPLLKGIQLVIFSKNNLLDTEYFISQLAKHKISRIVLVPSLLKQILAYEDLCCEKLNLLKEWTCSGETLGMDLVNKFYSVFKNHRLLNIYGSTEVTADATFFDTLVGRKKEVEIIPPPLLFNEDISRRFAEGVVGMNRPRAIIDKISSDENMQFKGANFNSISVDDYLFFVQNTLLKGTVNVGSPKFIGHMTSSVPPLLKELGNLVVSLNQNLVKFETSGVGTLIERQCIAMLHNLVYKNNNEFYESISQDPSYSLGVITSGGTMSNFTALSYSLSKKLAKRGTFKGVNKEGLVLALKEYNYKNIAVIGSEKCHYSIGKALKAMGLGEESFISYEIDKNNLVNSIDNLHRVIEYHQEAGTLIMAIIGIAGSTETGNVDPLLELGEVAKKFNIHFHVDAAFGGGYLFSEELAFKLRGIELANSVTICGHKQLYLPLGLSVCLFGNESLAAFSENNTRYQARKDSIDLGRYTFEGSRPFLALVLHGALNIVGKKGYAEIIESNYKRAELFKTLIIENKSFQLFEFSDLNIVLYRYLPKSYREIIQSRPLSNAENLELNDLNKKIQEQQFANGKSFVSYTKIKIKNNLDVDEILMFRTVLMNPYTTREHLKEILEEQEEIANKILGFNTIIRNKISECIGRPISNTSIYILDEDQNLVPVKVMGEIYIGGHGLSDGYINHPELTQEKFVNNPFKAGDRLYRTGDLGRWLPDGNIEFMGRKDDQVKIHGYRIELGEIESALQAHEKIESVVVIAKSNKDKEKELVAYVVSKEELNTNELRTYLKSKLPDYMVPGHYVQLSELPLTPNGKVNRKVLPDPEGLGINTGVEYVAPRNEIEERLVEIWSDVLGIEKEKIGIRDNFFDLGGNSILVILLLSKIRRELAKELKWVDLFNNLTIFELSNLKFNDNIKSMIKLNDFKKSLRNIYLIPPIVGSPLIFKTFAMNLNSQFNCFGLQINGIEKDELLDNSIEDIADGFSKLILKNQGEGEFVIIGYSFGSLIAFELAKILEGLNLSFKLILVDTMVVAQMKEAKAFLNKNEQEDWLKGIVNYYQNVLDNDQINRYKKLIENNYHLIREYVSHKQINHDILGIEAMDNIEKTEMINWQKFTKGKAKIEFVSGNHTSIFSKQNLSSIVDITLNLIDVN